VWIIPSSIASRFARVSDSSMREPTPGSVTSDSDPVLWPTVSGTASPQPASWRGWKRRAWSRPLFTQGISETSTAAHFVEWWTASLLDCPANPTPSRASRKGTPTTAATAKTATGRSRTPSASSPSVSPPWCSSRTCLPGFLEDGFDLSEKNYADWVSRSKACSLSLRKALERATEGSVRSSWPTPNTAPDAPNGGLDRGDGQIRERETSQCLGELATNWATPRATEREQHNSADEGEALSLQTKNWPTVRSHEVGEYQNQKDGTTLPTLTGAVVLWTTPDTARRGTESLESQQARKAEGKAGCASLLTEAEKLWQTPHCPTANSSDMSETTYLGRQTTLWCSPQAPPGGNTSRGGDRIDEPLLGGQVQAWPTPNARDHKGTDLESRNGGASLSHAAQTGEFSHSSPQGPAPTGEPSPNTSGRRLSPAFVCWLMGAPWFWTRAEPISFGAEETRAYRSKLQSLLSSLCER
jgi:hypothetical protein